MARLFDSGQRRQDAEKAKRSREEVRLRAEEVDRLIAENLELDEASDKLGSQLAGAESVHAIHYEGYRGRGSKWNIEHAQVGGDYVYQLFPLRPTALGWKDVMPHLIAALDAIFPRSVQIKYAPPSEKFQLKYYTIRVENVTGLPGWEDAAKRRALHSLSAVDAWTVEVPAAPESA